jgi:hypothetical protein
LTIADEPWYNQDSSNNKGDRTMKAGATVRFTEYLNGQYAEQTGTVVSFIGGQSVVVMVQVGSRVVAVNLEDVEF